jgi:hypothetical protein
LLEFVAGTLAAKVHSSAPKVSGDLLLPRLGIAAAVA